MFHNIRREPTDCLPDGWMDGLGGGVLSKLTLMSNNIPVGYAMSSGDYVKCHFFCCLNFGVFID